MNLLNPREPISTWSHALWLLMALVGLVFLKQRGLGDRSKQIVLLIYGLSLVFCSGCSTLYHGVRLSSLWIERFGLMDHIGIYMLIAGTYTPIAWILLRGLWRWSVLGVVWAWAALGVWMRLTQAGLSPWLSTGFYLAMGWGAVFCYFEVARRVTHRALVPIVAGGLLYSIGAVFNVLGRPVLWHGVFHAHELFHVCVVAASMCHFFFILTVAAPDDMIPVAPPWYDGPRRIPLDSTALPIQRQAGSG
jgi:hemolysin III